MAIYRFEDRMPQIAASAWVFPDAVIIGDVRLGENVYVGAGAILRGDYGTIFIGDGTAIEEGVIVHARPGDKTVFGKRVTVGHGAMIHNATIGDEAVIGMRATVSDYAEVGAGAIIGEGALVRNKQVIPPWKVAVGVPCKVIGDVEERHKQMWSDAKKLYIYLARRYPSGLTKIG